VLVVPVLVALKVGTTPETKLLFASLSVIVIVEVLESFAVTGPVPDIVEFPATEVPAVKVTVPPDLENGDVILRVLTSAYVDAKVHWETPPESDKEQVP